tara:strand:+ start:79 stop:849 length:771 start_codon:yes stop_codon:yes gene_type:complete
MHPIKYKAMMRQLTRSNGKTPEENRLADLKRNLPNQKRMLKKRNELGIDTTALQNSINKVELELEQFKAPVKKDVFEKIGDDLVDNLIKYDDLDPKEQIVKYDSATGLFSNNKRDIAFKDSITARKHNEVYEKYIPEIQQKKKAVAPRNIGEYFKGKEKPKVTPRVKPIVKPIVKPTVAVPIPEFDMNYQPYKRDPKEILAEERFNKILDENRKQKELEATQGLLGLVPGSSKILERSESRMEQIKPKTYGGDDDL